MTVRTLCRRSTYENKGLFLPEIPSVDLVEPLEPEDVDLIREKLMRALVSEFISARAQRMRKGSAWPKRRSARANDQLFTPSLDPYTTFQRHFPRCMRISSFFGSSTRRVAIVI